MKALEGNYLSVPSPPFWQMVRDENFAGKLPRSFRDSSALKCLLWDTYYDVQWHLGRNAPGGARLDPHEVRLAWLL